jgi:hypothetical protein
MLNDYGLGDYLIWALPEEKVFVDGRGDVYDWGGVLQEYVRWATLVEDPRKLLEKYRIRFCLLAANNPIARVMPYIGWRTVYADDVAQVLVR